MTRAPHRFVLGLAALVVTQSAAFADSPPPLPSLRHIVYSYTYDVRQTTENPDERNTNPSNGEGGTVILQSGNVNAGSRRTGTIVIDVVAATGDGGLVADVREGETSHLSDPVRCTVASDATVVFDPSSNVTDESQAALRFLSRGFFKPPDLKTGATWTIDHAGTGYNEHADYRLTGMSADSTAAIAFDATRNVRGSRFIQSVEHGELQYQTILLVPKSFATRIRTVETIGTRRRSTEENYGFDLISDSFAKAK